MGAIEAPFPSSAWFVELVARATADPADLGRLGIADLRFGMEVQVPDGIDEFYGLVLDGYDIGVVGPTTEDVFAPDVVVSGPLDAWEEMVDWIAVHGPADSAHSLNGLTIAGVPLVARSEDAMGSDKFYRFMGTVQAIFDAAGAPAPGGGRSLTVALEIDDTECLGCGACESACPQGAITQGGAFPVAYEVDPLRCNDCQQCLVVCPVDGLVADPDWAVCHGRGCPLLSRRYQGVECSEGREVCPTCGSVLWRSSGGPWECRACVAVASGSARAAGCPKVRRSQRLAAPSGA